MKKITKIKHCIQWVFLLFIFLCSAAIQAQTTPVNLNNQLKGNIPTGSELKWFTTSKRTSGTEVSDPTAVKAGTYFGFFVSTSSGSCISQESKITVITSDCLSTADLTVAGLATVAPTGFTLRWFDNPNHTGTPLADATKAPDGKYYAFHQKDSDTTVFNPASDPVIVATTIPATELVITTVPPDCKNLGKILVKAETGTGWKFSRDGTNFVNGSDTSSTEITFSGLAAGDYTIFVKKDGACTIKSAVQKIGAQPVSLSAPTFEVTPSTCTEKGKIIVNTISGAQYSIKESTKDILPFQDSPTFSDLDAGTYSVFVKSKTSGCDTQAATTAEIKPLLAKPDAVALTPTDADCNKKGKIVVTAPIGTGITYSIKKDTDTASGFTDTLTYDNLDAGNYVITAKNANKCESVSSVTKISAQKTKPDAATTKVTQAGCEVDGSILITAPTGSGITYSIKKGNDAASAFTSTTNYTGLGAGDYIITTKGSNDCTTDISKPITIDPVLNKPDALTLKVTDAGCDAKGSIEITAPISSNITYSIKKDANAASTLTSTTLYSNLDAGDYIITATNREGCSSSSAIQKISAQKTKPDAATLSVTNAGCDVDGSILITAPIISGITYSIKKGTDAASDFTTTTNYTGLTAGNYIITTKGSNGCTTDINKPVTIDGVPNKPGEVSLKVTDVSCDSKGVIEITSPIASGITYSIKKGTDAASNFTDTTKYTNLDEGDYIISAKNATCTTSSKTTTIKSTATKPTEVTLKVTDAGCDTKGKIEITAPIASDITYSIKKDNEASSNFTSSLSYSDLAAGSYIITSRKGTLCTTTPTKPTVISPTKVSPSALETKQTDPTCFDKGSIEVTAPLNSSTQTGFTYSVNGTDFQSDPKFLNLDAKDYTVSVKGSNGCISSSASKITIKAQPSTPSKVTATVSSKPSCTVSTGTITVSPITTGLTYAVRGTNPVTTEVQNTTGVFNQLAPGVYDVMALQNGCYSSALSLTIDANASSPAKPTASVTQQTSCSVSKGIIEVSLPVPGTGITYEIEGVSPAVNKVSNSTGIFKDLTPGTYNVVTLLNNCTSGAVNLTINAQPITPDSPVIELTDSSCKAKGSIKVTSPTGSGFTYSKDGISFQESATFSNLDPADYTITVKSAGGCTTASEKVTTVSSQPVTPAVVTATVSAQPSCLVSTGTITVTAPANQTGITYTVSAVNAVSSTTNSTGIFKELTPGDYEVTTTNARNCTSPKLTLTVETAPVIPASATPLATSATNGCPTATFDLKNIEPAAVSGVSYEWWTGTATTKNTQVVNGIVSASGNYFLWSKATSGCYSTSGSSGVNVTIKSCQDALILQFDGQIYNDTDKNCVQSTTENGKGLPTTPLFVKVLNSSGVAIFSTPQVDSNNDFFFSISIDDSLLPDGSYKLIVDDNNKLNDAVSTFPSLWTGTPLSFTIKSGAIVETFNGGILPLCMSTTGSIKPDFATTDTNVPTNGNLSTNDKLPAGTTYGNPIGASTNPTGATFKVNPDGTYTFTDTTPGKYQYTVPVCPAGQTTGCPTTVIEFTVVDPKSTSNKPIVNNDTASVKTGTSTTTNILANDSSANSGTTLDPSSVTVPNQPANGTVVVNSDGTIRYTPKSGFVGTDIVTYRVCDTSKPAQCQTATVTYTVDPASIPSTTAAADDFVRIPSAATATGNLLTNDSNSANSSLAATVVSGPTAAQGVFTLKEDGSYTFVPAPGVSGPIAVVYSACSKTTPAVCSNATLYILVQAEPNIKPDILVAEINVPSKGNLATNDTLPAGSSYGQAVPFSSNPAGGTIEVKPDGSYTFTGTTPGKYQYTVPVCPTGQTTGCPTTTLEINVVDTNSKTNKPVVNNDIASVPSGGSITTNVLANDKPANQGTTINASSLTIVTQPANGTATLNSDGTIKYTPKPGFVGTDSVTYQVCDTSNPDLCQSATVFYNVTEANATKVPLASDDYNKTLVNVPITGTTILANDTASSGSLTAKVLVEPDQSQGKITINSDGTYTFVPAANYTGTVAIVYEACNGTTTVCSKATLYILVESAKEIKPDFVVTEINVPAKGNLASNDTLPAGSTYGTPVGSSTNPSGGSLDIKPDGSYTFTGTNPGKYTFVVPVCPKGQTTACPTTTLEVTVVDPNSKLNKPIVNSDTDTVASGGSVTTDILANDKPSNTGTTINRTSVTVPTQPANGTVVVNADGTIKYTPKPGFVGTDIVTYSVCDTSNPAQCQTARVSYTVTEANAVVTPSLVDDFAKTPAGIPLTSTVVSNDKIGSATFEISKLTDLTATQGTITFKADGSYTFVPATGFYGPLEVVYSICTGTPKACSKAVLRILVEAPKEIKNDFAVSDMNAPVNGSLATNDNLPAGTTYGNPTGANTNPAGATLKVNPDGTYSFTGTTPGKYQYTIPVCPAGQTTGCPTTVLEVTVIDPKATANKPIVNSDTSTVSSGTSIETNVLANDKSANSGTTINPASLTITTQPANGTAVVSDGKIKYTPKPGFVGTDTVTYNVCDTSNPAQCQTATVTYTVMEAGTPIMPVLVDDFAKTTPGVSISGSVIMNDMTMSSTGTFTVTPITKPTSDQGDLDMKPDGTFTFVPAKGFTGSIDVIYEACTGSPSVCQRATLHLLVSGEGNTDIMVYNGLSPNGDGNNDFFRIQNIDLYPDNTVSIYNRWGVLVYEVQGYKNDINTPVFKGFSDGRVTISKGTLLPEGTYFYIIRYVNSASEVKERSGYLYLNQ